MNPAGPELADGSLNPFAVAAIREALNWLVDRRYIASELYGGLAEPRTLPLSTAFPDYARLAATARALELRYSFQPARAKEVIAREMKALGATRQNGRWHHDGEPVRLKLLIRTEDTRRQVGDYVANRLEDAGFAVERLYRTADQAAPLWLGADPAAGEWHLYTGGWVSTVINRDQAQNFADFYTPQGRPAPLWQAYDPPEALARIAERLERRDYASPAERGALMGEALELAMESSYRVWLVDQLNLWPRAADIRVAADLAGGLAGSRLWPYTLRFEDRVGGEVVISTPSMLTDPWNPVAGTNWLYDRMIINATQDAPALPDPFTGLYRPQRIAAAEVTVTEGTPVERSLDWVRLETRPEISVPEDTWVGWDGEAGRFVRAGERHPEGLTARPRTRITFEEGYLERHWHDGTRMSLADLVLPWILEFARADEDSPLFDRSHVPAHESFVGHFRGWRIVSRRAAGGGELQRPDLPGRGDHRRSPHAGARPVARTRARYPCRDRRRAGLLLRQGGPRRRPLAQPGLRPVTAHPRPPPAGGRRGGLRALREDARRAGTRGWAGPALRAAGRMAGAAPPLLGGRRPLLPGLRPCRGRLPGTAAL
ncbi:MAG: ABC transporter substrate-binding protein [Arhodomonas sp.]|nr:ABC transporter substrate-binding protein [Arhodomonas sp.]